MIKSSLKYTCPQEIVTTHPKGKSQSLQESLIDERPVHGDIAKGTHAGNVLRFTVLCSRCAAADGEVAIAGRHYVLAVYQNGTLIDFSVSTGVPESKQYYGSTPNLVDKP